MKIEETIMKLYDVKEPQECKLCGFKLSHNKNGLFTSHIIKQHGLTLEEYLLVHYYSKNNLKCAYELCSNLVKLRRGKHKKHCSKSCASKGLPLLCVICKRKFDTSTRPHRNTKTCSDNCTSRLRAESVRKWHLSMLKEEKEAHFKKIISKTAKTRRSNKTPSWNSGKTGIYSEETIEKIRQSTLKQMEEQTFRKTNIEIIMEKFLKSNHINYKYSFILQKRQYDFLLVDYNLIIECDGDYWHANPKFYPNPADWQIERIKNDHIKNEIAKRNNFKIIRFWEDDIVNNLEYVKNVINDLLATTQLETANVNAKKQ